MIAVYGVDNNIPQFPADYRQRCDFCTGVKDPEITAKSGAVLEQHPKSSH
jgi:hypothetical protein